MTTATRIGVPWALGVALLALGGQAQSQGWLWKPLLAPGPDSPAVADAHPPIYFAVGQPPAVACHFEVLPALPPLAIPMPPHPPVDLYSARTFRAAEARVVLEATRTHVRHLAEESTRVRTEFAPEMRGASIYRAG